MAEYIERTEALMKDICDDMCGLKYTGVCENCRFVALIADTPAADVAPVVHTRWAHLGGDEWCCPVCGVVITTEGSWDKPTKKYCEDCGAKMDGGDNTER